MSLTTRRYHTRMPVVSAQQLEALRRSTRDGEAADRSISPLWIKADCLRRDRAPATAPASRSLRSLPLALQAAVPLGRHAGATPALSTPPIPYQEDRNAAPVCFLELVPGNARCRARAAQ